MSRVSYWLRNRTMASGVSRKTSRTLRIRSSNVRAPSRPRSRASDVTKRTTSGSASERAAERRPSSVSRSAWMTSEVMRRASAMSIAPRQFPALPEFPRLGLSVAATSRVSSWSSASMSSSSSEIVAVIRGMRRSSSGIVAVGNAVRRSRSSVRSGQDAGGADRGDQPSSSASSPRCHRA